MFSGWGGRWEFRSFQGKNPTPAARPISEPAEEKRGDMISSLEVNKQRPRLIESAVLLRYLLRAVIYKIIKYKQALSCFNTLSTVFAVFVFFKQCLFASVFCERGIAATHPTHGAKALVDPLVPNTGSCILILGSQGFITSVEICSEHGIPCDTSHWLIFPLVVVH